jgi:hypothetical protein
MSTNMTPVPTHPSVRTGHQASLDTALGDGPSEQPPAIAPQLATVETVAGGTVAVTRIRMPFIFRILLALTGVRV